MEEIYVCNKKNPQTGRNFKCVKSQLWKTDGKCPCCGVLKYSEMQSA